MTFIHSGLGGQNPILQKSEQTWGPKKGPQTWSKFLNGRNHVKNVLI